ncbi:outer membrane lipoprotein carrier protein LolA [Lysobacteraceae bacterium NML95-0200]|nr:outer membrane lipoprotein carrier protein LolA [Xanthomonadaceae bacterium NML95-0200]
MKKHSSILTIALMLASGSALAGARDALNAFSHGLRTLDGGFLQEVYDSKGGLKESSAGKVSMSAPNLFRWQYVRPYQQLIVADGQTVWIYEPDLQQVSRRPQGAEEESSPLTALIDPARLDRDFDVAEEGSTEGMEWLSLTPKQRADSGFEKARLGFNHRGLARVEITDALGQRTVMSFGTWKRNGRLPGNTFRFTPPKGVDVIGQ